MRWHQVRWGGKSSSVLSLIIPMTSSQHLIVWWFGGPEAQLIPNFLQILLLSEFLLIRKLFLSICSIHCMYWSLCTIFISIGFSNILQEGRLWGGEEHPGQFAHEKRKETRLGWAKSSLCLDSMHEMVLLSGLYSRKTTGQYILMFNNSLGQTVPGSNMASQLSSAEVTGCLF